MNLLTNLFASGCEAETSPTFEALGSVMLAVWGLRSTLSELCLASFVAVCTRTVHRYKRTSTRKDGRYTFKFWAATFFNSNEHSYLFLLNLHVSQSYDIFLKHGKIIHWNSSLINQMKIRIFLSSVKQLEVDNYKEHVFSQSSWSCDCRIFCGRGVDWRANNIDRK